MPAPEPVDVVVVPTGQTVKLTKGELENQASFEERHNSMERRVDSMIAAVYRFQRTGRSKNAGVVRALSAALFEIEQRMEMAWVMSLNEGTVGQMGRTELSHYYPIIRRMYDVFAESRLLEPREVTESTQEGDLREMRQRDRDNPIMVYAHEPDCALDHIPRRPGHYNNYPKRCPDPATWEEL